MICTGNRGDQMLDSGLDMMGAAMLIAPCVASMWMMQSNASGSDMLEVACALILQPRSMIDGKNSSMHWTNSSCNAHHQFLTKARSIASSWLAGVGILVPEEKACGARLIFQYTNASPSSDLIYSDHNYIVPVSRSSGCRPSPRSLVTVSPFPMC